MPDSEPAQTGPATGGGTLDPLRFVGDLQLQNPCSYPESGARRVRPWLTVVLTALAPAAASFTVRFVSDQEMRRLNRSYRQKDATTDVLSFPGDFEPRSSVAHPSVASEGADEVAGDEHLGTGHLGDVAISVPVARRQAAERGHSVERELRFLMLHGLLHCLGYDHETDDGTMERLEQRLRARWIDHG